jgi:N-acetylneuraminate synthase
MKTFQIGDVPVGQGHKPLIIAEMSGNHNQSLDRALDIVDAAAKTGVQMIKLQTYTADTMTLDLDHDEFFISDPNSLWAGSSLYDLYKVACTPWEWHEAIFQRAKDLGLMCISTPFDESAVDFLEELNAPAYKIAAFENNHIPLLKKVAATGKPLIISTGMASLAELDTLVETVKSAGCENLVLLKCTSNYPASPKNSNLATIPHMRDMFKCHVGLSDHTGGVGVSVAAVVQGAVVIEKHFTLSRADGGVDSAFSLEPSEMNQLVVETERAFDSIGSVTYGPTAEEEKSLVFRRSIYICKDVSENDVLTEDNIKIIRPGLGLAPKYYESLLGRRFNKSLSRGDALEWTHVV